MQHPFLCADEVNEVYPKTVSKVVLKKATSTAKVTGFRNLGQVQVQSCKSLHVPHLFVGKLKNTITGEFSELDKSS